MYYPVNDQYRLPVMVTEMTLLSLSEFVRKYNAPLSVTLSILDGVCLGLSYLHTRVPSIIHQNLTPTNILLSHYLEAKITDIGVSKLIQTVNSRSVQAVTQKLPFMPPESLYAKVPHGLPIDVFSFGGVILFATTRMWPEPTHLLQINDSGGTKYLTEVERRQQYLDKMSGGAAELKPLVILCLDNNPSSRPSVGEVSTKIKCLKDACNKKYEPDWLDSIVWWAKVLSQDEGEEKPQRQVSCVRVLKQ